MTSGRTAIRFTALALAGLLAATIVPAPASGAPHNDAGSGMDAGGSFDTALLVPSTGAHWGRLEWSSGDVDDFYMFWIDAGESISIDVYAGLFTGAIQVSDANRRAGIRLYDPHGIPVDTPNSNVGDARVTFPPALVSGHYRLQFNYQLLRAVSYGFCFVTMNSPCVTHSIDPIQLGSPLAYTHTNVLLVPPKHGNPFGTETPLDYLDAALDGIRRWDSAFAAFAADYPAYAYLTQITTHVEIFDGNAPQRVGYDVVIVWAEYTGPMFRGLASTQFGAGPLYSVFCQQSLANRCSDYYRLEPFVHDSSRLIVMSSFAAAPRAGQVLPDYPEFNDIANVMMHEFAHTWGLGHSTTWTANEGPDLMNSPYPLVFGDGDPLGDGGERSPFACISSLDLYGMARLYEWVGRGVPYSARQVSPWAYLPAGMPYKLYC